ncbi:anaphase-promoting complex, cyclosome, subunit 4-domain-containing protein [Sporodiniella umbellata]|nr:anaphase-promoting complex, cyclosome, subunit 4-domain-containing protein [Sporodiniella umbellata]
MPEVELIMLLATGGLSPVTKQLLQECLTPQFIKQWESTNMQGYRQILLILCEYVLPSLEQILLELSHLLGYGRWKERYSDFLEPTRIEEWIKSIQKLIVYTRELTDKLRRLLKIFEAFTQWLHIISLKLSDTDSEELKSLSSLCKEPELVFEYLEECGLLDEPLETLSKKMLVKSINPFRLGKTPSSDNCSLAFASTKDNTSQSTYYAFIEPGQKGKSVSWIFFLKKTFFFLVIILKSSFTKSSFQYACILVPDTISDVKFFDFRELCIVTHNQQNTTLQTVYLDKIKYKNCISNFANNLGNEQVLFFFFLKKKRKSGLYINTLLFFFF